MQNKWIHILPVGKTNINKLQRVNGWNQGSKVEEKECKKHEINVSLYGEMEKDFLLWQIIFKRDAETKQMKQK